MFDFELKSGLKTNNYPELCTEQQSLAVDDLGMIKVYHSDGDLDGFEYHDKNGKSIFRNGKKLDADSTHVIEIKPNERLVGIKCLFLGQDVCM